MDQFATDRLIARKLDESDLDDLVRLHLDADVSRFLGGVRSPEVTAAYLAANIRHWDEHGFGLWTFRRPDGAFVGRAGLRRIELEGLPELEIAYALVRDAWGRGLASEIAQALVEVWRAHMAEPGLIGIASKGNSVSERVLLKTGFSFDRDAVFHGFDVGVFRLDRNRPQRTNLDNSRM
jgi:RimJ/RimL family protein N-acetyltransferase